MKPPDSRGPFFGHDVVRAGPVEIGVFVPPEEVFPGTIASEKALVEVLAALSRDDVLFHCARINRLVSGPGDFDVEGRRQHALNTLCTEEIIGRINDFARRHPGAGRPMVFFRGQLLELMRWAARHCRNLPGDGETFADPGVRRRFVQAALIAGVLWSNRTYGARLSSGGKIEEVRRRALGALRKGVEEGNLAPHLGVTLGRGRSLFSEYFPRRYPGFEEAFRRATKMTVDQYLTCLTGLSIYTIFNGSEGPIFASRSVGAATAYREIFPVFLALESQSPDQLAESFWKGFEKNGYRALRERPIMVTDDGRAIILDPTFFSEKISIGPLFQILAHAEKGRANEIFGAFGLAFEDYASDILKRMYPPRPGLVDRVTSGACGCDASGRTFEIDASLTDVRKAAVFEMKAAWLREDAIVDETHENLLNHIRAKYGASTGTGDRDKGVAQLARIVGAICREEWLGANKEFADISVLYPVLVVHDGRMDAPALGHFLNAEFMSLLGTVPTARRVAPLTVMTINDLENLESSIDEFSFIELLVAYERECPDRLRSLHNFVAYSDYGKKINPSGYLIKSSTELLEQAQQALFPK